MIMIRSPRQDRVTQGTIFCGGISEGYDNKPVWGVVITARCDTAQEKTPIVNYLPLVCIEDWLHQSGGRLVIDKAISDITAEFKNLLTQRALSHSLLEVHAISDLVSVHFPEPDRPATNKKEERENKQALQARGIARELNDLKSCIAEPALDGNQITVILQKNRKAVHAVVENLISNKLAGFYFIPNIGEITEYQSRLGYVIHLREVRHMSMKTANALLNGISIDDALTREIVDLNFSTFDFAFPVAEITSPWIEHLMQSFCNLFGRIGLTDIDKSITSSIVASISPLSEETV